MKVNFTVDMEKTMDMPAKSRELYRYNNEDLYNMNTNL